jgi:hypothetical protein
MWLSFTCEKCGKRIQVDERFQGKRGRCSSCRHVMRIPRADSERPEQAPEEAPASAPAGEPVFRLSPPEPPPLARVEARLQTVEPAAPPPQDRHHAVPEHSVHQSHPDTDHVWFDLLDDDVDAEDIAAVSPEIKRGLEEIAEFDKDRRGYRVVGERSGPFSYLRVGESGPAHWLYVEWRGGVNSVLRVLRFIDTWAYLLSVPFLMLMIFGVIVESRRFVHTGAAVVVLANYGRFWADLIALFVRPYKDGPLQGLAFLFPPYTIYYLATRWDPMKKILRRIATSCIPIVLVILIYAFVPSVNPEARTAQGLGARLEAGKQELDRDIESDLKGLGKRLIGKGTSETVKSNAEP